ncbi:MAG: exosome complex protein Rrp42 [Candidatus Micrarchaeota archaeon]
MIIDEVREEYVKDLLKKGQRVDGRGMLDYRPIVVTRDYLPNAEGGALAQIGDTKVVAGVKFDLMTPFPDRPEEGVFMTGSEFSPLAHPDFTPGPPNENSIELARVVDRAIRSAECMDLKKFYLGEEKVMGVFVDLYILDHCGNLIDAAGLAAMAALRNAKVPKFEDGKLIRDEPVGPLPIQRDAVLCSFERIDGTWIADATNEEEVASEGRLTLGVTDGDLLCAGQKSGRVGLKQEELLQLVDLSLDKGKELLKIVKG